MDFRSGHLEWNCIETCTTNISTDVGMDMGWDGFGYGVLYYDRLQEGEGRLG